MRRISALLEGMHERSYSRRGSMHAAAQLFQELMRLSRFLFRSVYHVALAASLDFEQLSLSHRP
jgi:hypothetical protein